MKKKRNNRNQLERELIKTLGRSSLRRWITVAKTALYVLSAIICAAAIHGYKAYTNKKQFLDQHKTRTPLSPIDRKLYDLSKYCGLFFFFKEDCSSCKKLATVVKGFSVKHGWDVAAISKSGAKHDLFARSEKDNGLAEMWKAEYPSVFVVSPDRGVAMKLVLSPSASLQELEEKVSEMPKDEATPELSPDSVNNSVQNMALTLG